MQISSITHRFHHTVHGILTRSQHRVWYPGKGLSSGKRHQQHKLHVHLPQSFWSLSIARSSALVSSNLLFIPFTSSWVCRSKTWFSSRACCWAWSCACSSSCFLAASCLSASIVAWNWACRRASVAVDVDVVVFDPRATPMFGRKVDERLTWLRLSATILEGDFYSCPSSSSFPFSATICSYIEWI